MPFDEHGGKNNNSNVLLRGWQAEEKLASLQREKDSVAGILQVVQAESIFRSGDVR